MRCSASWHADRTPRAIPRGLTFNLFPRFPRCAVASWIQMHPFFKMSGGETNNGMITAYLGKRARRTGTATDRNLWRCYSRHYGSCIKNWGESETVTFQRVPPHPTTNCPEKYVYVFNKYEATTQNYTAVSSLNNVSACVWAYLIILLLRRLAFARNDAVCQP